MAAISKMSTRLAYRDFHECGQYMQYMKQELVHPPSLEEDFTKKIVSGYEVLVL